MKTRIKNYEFEYDEQLTEYIIPDGVKKIDYFAFEGCTNLKSITIPQGCRYYYAFGDNTKVIIR